MSEDKREFARQLRPEMTTQEGRVWRAVRDRRLAGFKFRRRQVIDLEVADFYCDVTGVVLELDGIVHEIQLESEVHRVRVIASRGLLVLQDNNEGVGTAFADVMAELLKACQERMG